MLATAVLHFIGDEEDPYAITRTLSDAMPSGSHLVITHITADDIAADADRKAQAVYARATAQAHPRSRDAVTRFFDGLELADPGVVSVSAWRPGLGCRTGRTLMYAGVGCKPQRGSTCAHAPESGGSSTAWRSPPPASSASVTGVR